MADLEKSAPPTALDTEDHPIEEQFAIAREVSTELEGLIDASARDRSQELQAGLREESRKLFRSG